MATTFDTSCGCPPSPHPPVPRIPSGLDSLPRQLVGFGEYREAMLAAITAEPALVGWRGRGRFDLGVMLLESWAYVLDVTAFYDERVAERSYLQTAPDPVVATRIVSLLGHRRRPAMAAKLNLAVTALGEDPVAIPVASPFRSDPFDGNPAQVFETIDAVTIWPERNTWTLAPVRPDSFDGANIWLASRRAPHIGATVLLQGTGTDPVAGRVADVINEQAADKRRYQRVLLRDQDAGGLAMLGEAAGVSLSLLRIELGLSPFVDQPTSATDTLVLESLYPITDQTVVVEVDGTLHPRTVVSSNPTEVIVARVPGTGTPGDPVKAQVTELVLSATVPAPINTISVHTNALDLGRVTSPAKTTIEVDDLTQQPGGAKLENPVPPLGDAPPAGSMIAQGARDRGALMEGTIVDDGLPSARMVFEQATTSFPDPLKAPITLFGNVLEVVRGESVFDELLGVGDATANFLTLPTAKQPLTWVEDHSSDSGRRPELVVRVDGVEWSRVQTFFEVDSNERVYRVVVDEAGESSVVFGGDGFGAVPPTGSDIRADYRYGAGAATPPARAVANTARPVDGLDLVMTSLAATGGADAETIDELKTAAPAATLTLGRAVSLLDFEALAKSYANVYNASAGWAWDPAFQRATAKIWIIPAAGDPSVDLAAWLQARAVPDLAITVQAAEPAPQSVLTINLDVAPGHNPDLVATAVETALFDETDGLLSPRNVVIGGPLFRSVLTERVHTVAGVRSISSILVDGAPMPMAIEPGIGRWFDFADNAEVMG